MPERILLQHLRDLRAGRNQAAALPATTTFLRPTRTNSECLRGEDCWTPPSASIASRRPPARSRGFSRGSVVDPRSNRAMVFESNLEHEFACILMADRRVVHIHDQPPAVIYRTPDGTAHRHTFDFLAVTEDGRRLAFAVKPSAKVMKSGIEQTLEYIRQQAPKDFADSFLLRTERHITKDRAFNASVILHARRGRNEDDVQALLKLAHTLNGAIRLGDLVAWSGLDGWGRNAVICLIDDGVLTLASPGRIDDDAMVRMGGAAHA